MSLDELLAALRSDYLAQLPNKITIIESQIHAGAVDDLRESFHKLKGTGKTYGLPEVSELAEVIEELCVRRPESAVAHARLGLEILKDVCRERQIGRARPLDGDSRLTDLRKLLPN